MPRISIHEKATLLGDVVFAVNDGIITTFAVVAGVTGASLSSSVILILGFANLFADGLSMASGHYLGIKSEIEFQKSQRDVKGLAHSPITHGLVTFVAFILAGLVPLLPYLFNFVEKFMVSTLLVAGTLFWVGAVRAYLTKKNIFSGGAEMLMIGGAAAAVAFIVGFLLRKYVI